jgi:hypothetical protein
MILLLLVGGYTEENEMSMRAKINFYATQVGEHSNILRFLGAVVDDVSRKFWSIERLQQQINHISCVWNTNMFCVTDENTFLIDCLLFYVLIKNISETSENTLDNTIGYCKHNTDGAKCCDKKAAIEINVSRTVQW